MKPVDESLVQIFEFGGNLFSSFGVVLNVKNYFCDGVIIQFVLMK